MRDFNHTVNVLVKAYLDNDLRHNSCEACAVGNIVGSFKWRYLFITEKESKRQYFYSKNDEQYEGFTLYEIRKMRGQAHKIINRSGYSVKELAKVEYAFEISADYNLSPDERMFKSLMAVVDVLAEIHGISLEQKSVAKAMFVKETI